MHVNLEPADATGLCYDRNQDDRHGELPDTHRHEFQRGIRGSFGVENMYCLDGLNLRDTVSGGSLTSINTTSIKEVEVPTDGWNTEYGGHAIGH